MLDLIIENVRCFHARQTAPIAPLTFLVGENSSGKSTFLSLVRAAWDVASGNLAPDFNEEPFLLGAYDQIATYRGGRGGRAKSFVIGHHVAETLPSVPLNDSQAITFLAAFEPLNGQPRLANWSLSSPEYGIDLRYSTGQTLGPIQLRTPSGTRKLTPPETIIVPPGSQTLQYLEFMMSRHLREGGEPGSRPGEPELQTLRAMLRRFRRSLGPRPYAFAPIRTRPKRTYDPLKDLPEPEGSHVPLALARMFSTAPDLWKQVRSHVDGFGTSAGLFRRIDVRRMGQKDSDPFQLRVKIAGPAFNLVDVGYGVSQVLPIVVDCLAVPEHRVFLLQQPEVHLHPQAQAALGSFLGVLVKANGKRFVVETHSDYLLDRVRMDIRDGRQLGPDDVSILYFERSRGKVKIHNLRVDSSGNVVGAPRGYRRFFLDEEKRFMRGL